MTKEELRDRFYVETGILEPFERLEEYMSWLEQKVIELSKLHQPTVSICACGSNEYYVEQYKDVTKYYCKSCHEKISQH